MNWRVLGGTAVLWIVTVGVVAALFLFRGIPRRGPTDGRKSLLAPAERDLVLAEMRDLLKAVHGVVTVLGSPHPNLKEAEGAARAGRHGNGGGCQPCDHAETAPGVQAARYVHP
ncbi:MAG: hypothetical protein MRJ92_01335 [Nitrospira sp.]|nr:hypothetical protein [Nitrospira sp.]